MAESRNNTAQCPTILITKTDENEFFDDGLSAADGNFSDDNIRRASFTPSSASTAPACSTADECSPSTTPSDDSDSATDDSSSLPKPKTMPVSRENVFDSTKVTGVAEDGSLDDHEHDPDTKCSLFGWQPQFLQRLANIKIYLTVLILRGTLLGMLHSYNGGVISTIEKRFHLPSSVIGTMAGIGEIGELLTIFFVAHYGGAGHRPRWLAAGSLILALAAALYALPELFAPPNELVDWTPAVTDHLSRNSTVSLKSKADIEICRWNLNKLTLQGNSSADQCATGGVNLHAGAVPAKSPTFIPPESWAAVCLFTAAALTSNVAASFGLNLILPYIHDNVGVRNSPIYFSVFLAGQIGGPILGNAMASVFTALWVKPLKGPPPGLSSRDDPRWIGAWYMGFAILSGLLVMISVVQSVFPRRMPRRNAPQNLSQPTMKRSCQEQLQEIAMVDANLANESHVESVPDTKQVASSDETSSHVFEPRPTQTKKNFKQLPKDLLLILLNFTVMARAVGAAFEAFVYAGFAKFLFKYAEVNFRYPAYIANIVIGFSGLVPVAIGMLTGAFIIRRFNMQPRHIAFSMFFVHGLVSVGSIGMALFNCGGPKLAGLDFPNAAPASTTPPKFSTLNEFLKQLPYANCSNNCQCRQHDFNPVCDLGTGLTYFSPCHAGCSLIVDPIADKRYASAASALGSSAKLYINCSCATDIQQRNVSITNVTDRHRVQQYAAVLHSLPPNARAMKSGRCEGPCKALFGYVALKIVLAIIMALPISGSTMILYRIVAPDLKSMAQGVQSFLTSSIAYGTGPIIVGAIFDRTCRLWNSKTDPCTGTTSLGNCLLYDADRLRWMYHLLPAGVRMLATLCDFVVFLRVRHLTFDKDDMAAAAIGGGH